MHDRKPHPELNKSRIVKALPKACAVELSAVEFFEAQRWGKEPRCVHCGEKDVYKMTDREGARNKRFLWRCRVCGEQYTVRIGTIYEDSRLPLRHWAYAFWKACSSKKGVSARQIQRECQITYKSALFLMHRIRWAMHDDTTDAPKLGGEGRACEVDETYCGGKPRPASEEPPQPPRRRRYRTNPNKTPVVAMLERGGTVRTTIVPSVTQWNLRHFLAANIAAGTVLNTDSSPVYNTLPLPIGRHDVVNHTKHEYWRRNADGTASGVNHCESFFSLLKRGLMGTFHAVSREHLFRYCDEFSFRWNTRRLNDGQRIALAIRNSLGKRLVYADAKC
jgi:transposase-like protein